MGIRRFGWKLLGVCVSMTVVSIGEVCAAEGTGDTATRDAATSEDLTAQDENDGAASTPAPGGDETAATAGAASPSGDDGGGVDAANGESIEEGDPSTGKAEDSEVIEVVDPVLVEDGFFPSEFDGEAAVRRDRGINVLTARTVRKRALLFIVEHRPYESLFSGEDAFFDYFGFDGGNLKVALGFRFGILDNLDVGITRLSDGGKVAYDTYEFNARYAFLNQQKHQIDAAVVGGVTWFAQKDAKDAAGGFGQLFIDRVFFDMLMVGVGFAFHSESSSDVKSTKDDAFSGAVTGLLEWRMIDRLAFTAEVGASVFGYKEKWPALSFGLKVLTNRHVFTLMLTNTQFILADGIVANSWREPSDWVLGFQIVREFDF